MRTAAGSKHIRADAAGEADRKIGACASGGGGRGESKAQYRNRTARQAYTHAHHAPFARRSADLAGVNRNRVAGIAQRSRRSDQVALGAAAFGIPAPRDEGDSHVQSALRFARGLGCAYSTVVLKIMRG